MNGRATRGRRRNERRPEGEELREYSIQGRLLFFYAMTTAALLLVVTLVRGTMEASVLEVNESYYTSLLVQTAKTIDYHLEDYDRMSRVFSQNPILRFHMRQITNSPDIYGVSAQWGIKKQVLRSANTRMFRNIYVYMPGMDPIHCYYEEVAVEEASLQMEELMAQYRQGERMGASSCVVTGADPYQIAMIQPVFDGSRLLGLVRLDLEMDFFHKLIAEVVQDPGSTLVMLDERGRVVYSLDPGEILVLTEADILLEDSVCLDLPSVGWQFVGTLPQSKIQEVMTRFMTSFVIMVLLIMLTVTAYSLLTFHSLFAPMRRIMASMRRVEAGDLDSELSHSKAREYNLIIDAFNSMVKKVKELLETTYYQQVYLRKAQIGEMQSKFNPHFLYNTLDMIYWDLVEKEEESSAEMVVALSEILRYSITSNHEFNPLSEESRQIENYLLLQSKRLGEGFEWEIRFDEDILEFKVPCLLLQPLVENAIDHAFPDNRPHKYVGITGSRQGHVLVLTVTDNGVGMTREAIQRILDEEVPPDDKGSKLGIALVHKRLQYIYGSEYGIQIQSRPGEGCAVRVMLVASEQVDQYLQPLGNG